MNYEKLGSFYLGRKFDVDAGKPADDVVLYDAKDLTTHAVCVGMTGSGKTGLCVSLLEEAAIDGIPVIAIDPKGDIGNLLLNFPGLTAEEFAPWIDEGEAARKGRTPAEHADKTANLWRNGLQSWDQDGSRVQRLRDAADFSIYTPGSNAGLPLTILKSFAAPPAELVEDAEAFRDRVESAASGLVTLIGLDPDPLQSREHILVANLFDRAWREGRDLRIPELIREIQAPPFDKLGVFDLDSFYPAKDRFGLAMRLNNLLASPGFASWLEGEAMDITKLMHTPAGKPRVTVLSIAHMSESERMFFVTLLLNEIVSWVRTQEGTTSLRAILYMDEVFGYLPPVANPPSKKPMLTLLKQARAFGLGCVLATQNPVDLDYKALSNAGTWFLGRLQTERDKARVLDGLEGASAMSGAKFDRAKIEATLAGMSSRVFLMNNVHEDEPVLFHTRWAMSYLRGPLTRGQIKRLMDVKKAERAKDPSLQSSTRRALDPAGATDPVSKPAAKARTAAPASPAPALDLDGGRPVLPEAIEQVFLPVEDLISSERELVYRPALVGTARLHFISSTYDLDEWEEVFLLTPLDDDIEDPWTDAEPFHDGPSVLDREGEDGASYRDVPKAARKTTSYTKWGRLLKDYLYRSREVTVFRCKDLDTISEPGVTEGDFRIQLVQKARERRDLEIEKLRRKFAPKFQRLEDKMLAAEQKVEVEQSQVSSRRMESAVSIGSTLLGALFGRKKLRTGAKQTARSFERTAKEKADVRRAKEKLAALKPQFEDLERDFEVGVDEIRDSWSPDAVEVTERTFRPRKSDLRVGSVKLVWTPWSVDADGSARPLFD